MRIHNIFIGIVLEVAEGGRAIADTLSLYEGYKTYLLDVMNKVIEIDKKNKKSNKFSK